MANGKTDLNRNAFCDMIFLKINKHKRNLKRHFAKPCIPKKKKKRDRKSIKVDRH